MSTLILIFILLALWHFIYQAIILPSWRLKLRYKLFILRDKTRALMIKNQNDFNEETYMFLERRISVIINNLHFIEFPAMYEANKFIKANKNIEKEIQEKMSEIERCDLSDVKEIYSESLKIFIIALLANSGSWGPLLLPPAILIIIVEGVRTLIQKVLFLSDDDLDKLINNTDVALT